jgi:hypothetical protein
MVQNPYTIHCKAKQTVYKFQVSVKAQPATRKVDLNVLSFRDDAY